MKWQTFKERRFSVCTSHIKLLFSKVGQFHDKHPHQEKVVIRKINMLTLLMLLYLISRQSKLILHHTVCDAEAGELCLCSCLSWRSGGSPSCLSRLGELLDRPQARGLVARRRSVAAERNLPPLGEGLMSERLIADYGATARWEHTLLAGSNIFICAQTHTNTQAQSPPLPLTGRIHQHVESQMNIKPPPPPPPPPRGAAPLSPGSAAWRSAHRLLLSCGQGNYLPFCACVCASVGVYGFALECDAFTGTSFHICFLFWHGAKPAYLTGGWLACFFFPEAPEQGSTVAEAAASPLLQEE